MHSIAATDRRHPRLTGMLTAYYHPGFAAPIGKHIMPMEKFSLVASGIAKMRDVQLLPPQPATEKELLRVHTREYVASVRDGEPRTLAESQKFPWSPALYPSVCLTSGACIAAARTAIAQGASAAVASGFHHACAGHGEGFCTFNGLVVAADAIAAEGLGRTAVLDMDLHYGNGTALLATGRTHLFAVSIYGNDYHENVPYRDVQIRRHADGLNHRSFALPSGCERDAMLRIMASAFDEIASWKPDLLIYQAGADPFREDPFSPLALSEADLFARDVRVFEFTRSMRLPIAWVLAGGYAKDLMKVVRIHCGTFRAWQKVMGNSPELSSENLP